MAQKKKWHIVETIVTNKIYVVEAEREMDALIEFGVGIASDPPLEPTFTHVLSTKRSAPKQPVEDTGTGEVRTARPPEVTA